MARAGDPRVDADIGPDGVRRPILERDLAADARLASKQKIPLLVLFSEAGCPWCERARQEFLLPMQRNPEYKAKVIMREVEIGSGRYRGAKR